MRLWHKDWIKPLPKEQLVAQWRELSAIAGAIQKNGTPNHVLVNFVLRYPFDHFISYAKFIQNEMLRRGYRPSQAVFNKISALKPDWKEIPFEEIYKEKMNDIYFDICYYNLYEKILCGGIKEPDSSRIIHYCENYWNEVIGMKINWQIKKEE